MSEQGATYFYGVAAVNTTSFVFNHKYAAAHRQLNPSAVKKLKDVFEKEGCLRENEENYITAIVSQEDINEALASANLSPNSLPKTSLELQPPRLVFHRCSVFCLNGLQRIAAAEKILKLKEADPWWNVRLYGENIPKDIALRITEEFENIQPYTDGEIFWKILHYQFCNDDTAEKKWWARLTKSKQEDLKRLLRREPLTNAFKALHKFHGMWRPIRLGTLHRLLTLKCDEEMVCYLQHILSIWTYILGPNITSQSVDISTVEQLELQAPGKSRISNSMVESAIRSGLAFASISGTDRDSLLERVKHITCLIPTLKSFFSNLKYIEPLCVAMKELVKVARRETIRMTLFQAWNYGQQSLTEPEKSSPDETRLHCYQSLWLYAMRDFPQLTSFLPLQEAKVSDPSVANRPTKTLQARQIINPYTWYQFGNLATKLGFEINKENGLFLNDPELQSARQFLKNEGLPPETAKIDYADQIAAIMKEARLSRSESKLSDDTNCDEPLERRSGLPFEKSQKVDRENLYLDKICNVPKECISSLYVKYEFAAHFFGGCQGFNHSSNPISDDPPSSPEIPHSDLDTRNETSDIGPSAPESSVVPDSGENASSHLETSNQSSSMSFTAPETASEGELPLGNISVPALYSDAEDAILQVESEADLLEVDDDADETLALTYNSYDTYLFLEPDIKDYVLESRKTPTFNILRQSPTYPFFTIHRIEVSGVKSLAEYVDQWFGAEDNYETVLFAIQSGTIQKMPRAESGFATILKAIDGGATSGISFLAVAPPVAFLSFSKYWSSLQSSMLPMNTQRMNEVPASGEVALVEVGVTPNRPLLGLTTPRKRKREHIIKESGILEDSRESEENRMVVYKRASMYVYNTEQFQNASINK